MKGKMGDYGEDGVYFIGLCYFYLLAIFLLGIFLYTLIKFITDFILYLGFHCFISLGQIGGYKCN
jgi:hypothetical protein